ncbi:Uncharacterised protein [Legionella lansingensis]|uniref:Uncharacterized protein n=1 Tax=Legionella lansingensis TaxID=45067 RepID=A0A0W0W013_9GAMM|nr:hypothetical protein [Legionella lansingensis]KTD25708.1 hypothetical protein Llan_0098 [Legionella lansingensis]SNV49213.1 Uncharacterised protein [Legionella lansingensis]
MRQKSDYTSESLNWTPSMFQPLGNSKSQMTELSAVSLTPMELLLRSYKKYPLLEGYKDLRTIRSENRDYEGVELLNNPTDLISGRDYLYVITESGQIWFAPQYVKGNKLTHGGLLRKALKIPEGEPTPPVLSAGLIGRDENRFFLNLASGHFIPGFNAYFPTLETLSSIIPEKEVYIQFVGHYKSLDARSCDRINFQGVQENQSFRLSLLSYIQENSHKVALCDSVRKIFSAINVSGEDFSDEKTFTFSQEEVNELFKDEKLAELLKKHASLCPEEMQSLMSNLGGDFGMKT